MSASREKRFIFRPDTLLERERDTHTHTLSLSLSLSLSACVHQTSLDKLFSMYVNIDTSCNGDIQVRRLEDIVLSIEHKGRKPDLSVAELASILHKCRKEKNEVCAVRLHAYMRQSGLETHRVLGNHLVPLLVEVGSINEAHDVFSKLQYRNHISWNSLIAGYVKNERPDQALTLFEKMQEDECLIPNGFTYVPVLKACGDLNDLQRGSEIHAMVDRDGLLERDHFVSNTLIDMYARGGDLEKARKVFDRLISKDTVSWNVLIAGYAQHEQSEEALKCFNQMKAYSFLPDTVTFTSLLNACSNIKDSNKGQNIHSEITKKGLVETDHLLGNALINMYAKHGSLAEAEEVFNKLPARDVASWNALISGYAEHGLGHKALHLFRAMEKDGLSPNSITYACSLKACGCIGIADIGQTIHAELTKRGSLEKDLIVGSSLVDMYANCGSLVEAQDVFDGLSARDIVSWSALIDGYAQCGEADIVCGTIDLMIAAGIKPNQVTFVSVLTACSHGGLVERGEKYFKAMNKVHTIIPTLEHLTCMVVLLSRAGQLDKAAVAIKKMPTLPDLVVWRAMLWACQKLQNSQLGKQAFQNALQQMSTMSAFSYVSMSNILGLDD